MKDKLILPFDKIYCLHLIEDNKRFEIITENYKKYGVYDKIKFWWTTKKPISVEIGKKLQNLHTDGYNYLEEYYPNIYGGVFNCAFEHYSIIKQSYLRNFNSIMILEDDAIFEYDIEILNKYFSNLPKDWELIKFYSHYNDNKIFTDNLFTQEITKITYSTVCYALTKSGMKKVIDEYERKF